MTVIQLHDPLYVETPLGRGLAIIYESTINELFWTVVLNESGAVVQFRNRQIKVSPEYTYGRGLTDEAMRKIVSGGS